MTSEILIPPKVFICNVEVSLSDKERIYASTVQGKLSNELLVKILEQKGLDMAHCRGQEMECLLEIAEAEFRILNIGNNEELEGDWIEFKYLGYRSSCDFFPIPDEVKIDGELDKLRYRMFIDEQFTQYGENGFGLKPADQRPVLKTADGYSFLINRHLHKDLLMEIQKGAWLAAKIDKLDLLAMTRPIQRDYALCPVDRVQEELEQKKASKVKRRKRFGVF